MIQASLSSHDFIRHSSDILHLPLNFEDIFLIIVALTKGSDELVLLTNRSPSSNDLCSLRLLSTASSTDYKIIKMYTVRSSYNYVIIHVHYISVYLQSTFNCVY